MNNDNIGYLISRMRKDKHLTQQELAEKLGVSNKTISRWETGETLPEAGLILDLANELGITSDELLRGERDTAPKRSGTSVEPDTANLPIFLGRALYFRDPFQQNAWYMNYLFGASLLMTLGFIWQSRR
ncbi:MAG TPA: helix-turn-helix transcriptional regulator [Tissierellia bacterium]|nr:helix-turn-helix transcriptional regulator [Tissierellia bacterium]